MQLAFKIFIGIVAVLVLLAIIGRIYFPRSPRPAGVGKGTIEPCPESPNCVSTQASDKLHQIESLPLINGDAAATLDALEKITSEMPTSTLITRTDRYLYVEFRSAFWGFIDDAEFLVDAENGRVDIRMAARLGRSDLGANRARYEQIAAQFHEKFATEANN